MYEDALINIYGFILLFVGAIIWIAGYRLWKFFVYLTGFSLGFLATIAILASIYGSDAMDLAGVVVAFLGGIAGAYVMMLLVKLFIFVVGFLFGFGISLTISLGQNFADLLTTGYVPSLGNYVLIAAIIGLIAGIVALYYNKIAIILVTSYWGASSIVWGAWLLWYTERHSAPPVAQALLAILFLTVLGFAIQWRADAAPPKPANMPESPKKGGGSSQGSQSVAESANMADRTDVPNTFTLVSKLPSANGAMLSLSDKVMRAGNLDPKVLEYQIEVSYETRCLKVRRGRLFAEVYVHFSRQVLWDSPIAKYSFNLLETASITLEGKELLDPVTLREIRRPRGVYFGIKLVAEGEGEPMSEKCRGRTRLVGDYNITKVALVLS